MPRATWLLDAAKSTGYPVVEVAGWLGRGHGDFKSFEGVVGHHTGTAQTAPGDYPSLNIVTNGRSDLPGPLCNYGLGRNGTIYCVAAGVAWHAGTSSFAGFTNLNDKFLGIEAEHAGGTLPWPAAQLDAYVKLVAAILRAIGKNQDRYCSHRTCAQPAGRKPDPRGIDDAWMRGQVARLLGNSSAPSQPALRSNEEDEMAAVVLTFPAGQNQRQLMCVPPALPGTARFYLCTGWTDALIRAGYFVRDRGPGLTPVQEGWGGTGSFTLVQNDRNSWPLPDGCTGVGLEYDSGHPISVMVTYKPL